MKKGSIYEGHVKRWIDFVSSLLILTVLAPFLLIIAALVRIRLGSPVVFKQRRPGLGEKVFTIYKFRTMTDGRDEQGRLLPDEVRLTSFGRRLRETSCDELLELVNILKGDMSWCGPRPLLVRDMVFMSDRQRQRHMVRPGMTGLAQVNGRNNVKWEDKLEWDLKYIDDGITFISDMKIIFRTIGKVIGRADIHTDGMATAEDLGDYLLRVGKVRQDEYDRLQAKAKMLESESGCTNS